MQLNLDTKKNFSEANMRRIISILTDVKARLIESTRYNMDFAEHEIKDCVSLIDVVIKEMNENSTNTI